jgi:hypothetical protein
MNNRIRELAEASGAEAWSRPPMREVIGLAFTDYALEKFAELIIAECVDIADDYVKDYLVEEHIKFNHPRSKIGLKIRDHFGIEEK